MFALLFIATDCTALPLATPAEIKALLGEIDKANVTREKRACIDRFAGTRAVLATDAARIAGTLLPLTDRHDVAATLFSYVVDKDNWPRAQWVERVERLEVDGARGVLVIGMYPPIVCLAIRVPSPAEFATLVKLLEGESGSQRRWLLLRANQRDYMFTAAQMKMLMALLRYREQQAEAEQVLRVVP